MLSPRTAAKEGAIVVARPDLHGLVVSGPDRTTWLNGMVTNDLAPTRHGDAVYALALNKQGKILTDLVALEDRDRLVVAVDAAELEATLAHLDHFLIMEDAEIASSEEPHGWAVAFGPLAPTLAGKASASGEFVAAAGTVLGYPGAVFALRGGSADDAARRVAQLAPAQTLACGIDAFDAARVELGIPRFGVDFTQANYPMDVGLDERAISFNKGCYLGQEVVVKLRSRGKPVRALRRLRLPEDAAPPAPGTSVRTEDGKEIGAVTFASRLEPGRAAMAFALVRRAEIDGAERVLVGDQPAVVLEAWERS